MKKLQRKIMRRIYTAYALRVGTHPIVAHSLLLLLALAFLDRFVSFRSVASNVSQVPLGDVASYLLRAFLHTETWTLLLLGVIIFACLSLRFQVRTLSGLTLRSV